MADEKFEHWGKKDEQGHITRDTFFCALTGERVRGISGTVTCQIKGTRLFYKLTAQARRKLTDRQRQALEAKILDAAGITDQLPASIVKSPKPARRGAKPDAPEPNAEPEAE